MWTFKTRGWSFHSLVLMTSCLLLPQMTTGQLDQTVIPGAKGSEVVETVISRLETSCVFPDDKLFMRRLAYVESFDGADPNTFRPGYFGGIWQVDEDMFDVTQSTSASIILLQYFNDIKKNFGIHWPTVVWSDLTKPLHSALGARLHLQYHGRNDPNGIPRNITAQAGYWKSRYRPGGNTNEFIVRAERLENGCQSGFGPDIVFVLDGSGSIGTTNFAKIKDFVKGVVNAFEVDSGANSTAARFGVIQFGTAARREFDLKSYTSKTAVLQAVDRITYMNSNTYTHAALDELRINGFKAANGARSGHPKVGIVLTDGVSNYPALTKTAARLCHAELFTMFAIGVGTSVNMNELEEIASDPDCLHVVLLSFSDIDSLKYTIQKRSCDAPIVISPGQNSTTGGSIPMPPGGDQNCRIKVPTEGATIEVSTGGGGYSTFYTSKSTYPTSSFYDHMTVSGPDRLGVLYLENPQDIDDGMLYCNIKGDNQTATNISIGSKPGDHDKCRNHTCLNGATCVHTTDTRGYRCDCAPGYRGDDCGIISHCSPWQSFSQQQTAGGHILRGFETVATCLDVCVYNPNCYAVDYSFEEDDGTCWLHLSPLLSRNDNDRVAQYVINRHCLGNAPPESCYQWTTHNGQLSPGGSQQPKLYSISDCKDSCKWNPLCVGFDYDTTDAPCWLHLHPENLWQNNTYISSNVNQYRLSRVC